MLDDFNSEIENTDSKLDSTMKKVAKVLHMSNGKKFMFFIYASGKITGMHLYRKKVHECKKECHVQPLFYIL